MSTRGRKAELRIVDEDFQTSVEPEIPASIPQDLHQTWLNIIADLRGRKVLTDAMLGSVESYVLAVRGMRLAHEAIEKYGAVIDGPKGPTKNPAVTLLGKEQSTISRLAAELGLTPAARSRRKMSDGNNDDGTGQSDLFDRLMGF
ncbi:phage terminase small subunit P27 family [Sinorhizobium meliloti]|uniref:phage terminase small subunit P27 family n=1 Tax=Rhizobium meliloti TaxID=382 RepID=UPI00299D940D|nr:phage terminase small subunit P27 family [Sinorhizobium meliloti]MDW9997102.1 phage terminase small subunit P27 family [Sinorhizobium meliloti]